MIWIMILLRGCRGRTGEKQRGLDICAAVVMISSTANTSNREDRLFQTWINKYYNTASIQRFHPLCSKLNNRYHHRHHSWSWCVQVTSVSPQTKSLPHFISVNLSCCVSVFRHQKSSKAWRWSKLARRSISFFLSLGEFYIFRIRANFFLNLKHLKSAALVCASIPTTQAEFASALPLTLFGFVLYSSWTSLWNAALKCYTEIEENTFSHKEPIA